MYIQHYLAILPTLLIKKTTYEFKILVMKAAVDIELINEFLYLGRDRVHRTLTL